MINIKENIKRIRERIESTALKAGRKADEIRLVVVTKNVGLPAINEAIQEGINILGENRVQEALTKIELVDADIEWHMVGHLQRNKAKYVVPNFQLIHSLDSISLAQEINLQAKKYNKVVKTLVQVNTSQEDSKFGVSEELLFPLLDEIHSFEFLSLEGLMTIPPLHPDKEKSRIYFSKLRKILEEIQNKFRFPSFTELSMGMTNDFEIAIEEGATLIRLGTAIFGPRPSKG